MDSLMGPLGHSQVQTCLSIWKGLHRVGLCEKTMSSSAELGEFTPAGTWQEVTCRDCLHTGMQPKSLIFCSEKRCLLFRADTTSEV